MIRPASAADAEAIAAIYRPIVLDTAISFETVPPGPAEMERRIAATLEIAPWLVYEEQGKLGGYAYGSRHRERAAYQWSADVSVYVDEAFRRRGIGSALYKALFPLLRLQGFFAGPGTTSAGGSFRCGIAFRSRRHPARRARRSGIRRGRRRWRPRGSGRPRLLRLLRDPQIRLRRLPALRKLLLRILVAHGAGDDDVPSLLPVRGRRHLVLGGELDRVDDPEDLVEVPARGHRVVQDELDLLVGTDDEHRPHGGVVGRCARLRVARDGGRKHVVELRHLEVGIADHRIVRRGTLRLLDVLRPALVIVYRIDAEADDLDASLVELRLDARHVAELGRAHRREILRMREKNRHRIADPLVEVDRALGRLGGEVGCLVSDSQTHGRPPLKLGPYPNAIAPPRQGDLALIRLRIVAGCKFSWNGSAVPARLHSSSPEGRASERSRWGCSGPSSRRRSSRISSSAPRPARSTRASSGADLAQRPSAISPASGASCEAKTSSRASGGGVPCGRSPAPACWRRLRAWNGSSSGIFRRPMRS